MENTVLVTTKWDDLGEKATGEMREAELISNPDYWKGMIDKGARTARQDNGPVSARAIVGIILGCDPIDLKIVKEVNMEGSTMGSSEGEADRGKMPMSMPMSMPMPMPRPRPEMSMAVRLEAVPVPQPMMVARVEAVPRMTAPEDRDEISEKVLGSRTLGRLFGGRRKPSERQEETLERVERLLSQPK